MNRRRPRRGRRGGRRHVRCEFVETAACELETQCPAAEHVLAVRRGDFLHRPASRSRVHPRKTRAWASRDRRPLPSIPNTFAATRPGVFAAGDATTGTAFVIEAVASGHKVADVIHKYLHGERARAQRPTQRESARRQDDRARSRSEKVTRGEIHDHAARQDAGAGRRPSRKRSFDEVRLGYTDEEAQAEAARCLACGVCSECLSCYYKCGVNAIDHDMVERIEQVKVGAVILAPGYEVYNAKLSQEYGLGRYPNVVTSLQFERLLSASGPTQGHVKRPSDGAKPPKKIAFLQCVGSRDQTHDYCSSVCCMYAAKEAIMTIEHAKAEGHGNGESRRRVPRLFHGHARVQQRLRGILPARAEQVRRQVSPHPHQRAQAESARRQSHLRYLGEPATESDRRRRI